MHKMRVGVLRGGPSSEYDVSLQTGASVLKNLSEDKYEPVDVFIDKSGVWHVRGIAKNPDKIIQNLDVVFNALHGEYGEDGEVQYILDNHQIPYTGSRALPSAIGMNKLLTKQIMESHGIRVPAYQTIHVGEEKDSHVKNIFETMGGPLVIKPFNRGSSVGVTIAKDLDEFHHGIEEGFSYAPTLLIEEYISGKEATCGVIENFRGKQLYELLPIEIIPPAKAGFFSAGVKYTGETQEICPGNFSRTHKEELQNIARSAHEALGLRHYSRSDFIVSPKGIYFLEINTLPGLTSQSLIPKALEAVGVTYPQFLDHLIDLAYRGR